MIFVQFAFFCLFPCSFILSSASNDQTEELVGQEGFEGELNRSETSECSNIQMPFLNSDCFNRVFSFLDVPSIMTVYQLNWAFYKMSRTSFPRSALMKRFKFVPQDFEPTFGDFNWISKYSEQDIGESFYMTVILACRAGLSLPSFLPYVQRYVDNYLEYDDENFGSDDPMTMHLNRATMIRYLFQHGDYGRIVRFAFPIGSPILEPLADSLLLVFDTKFQEFLPPLIAQCNVLELHRIFGSVSDNSKSKFIDVVAMTLHVDPSYLDGNFHRSFFSRPIIHEIFIRAVLHSYNTDLTEAERTAQKHRNHVLFNHLPHFSHFILPYLELLNEYLFGVESFDICTIQFEVLRKPYPLLMLALGSVVKGDIGFFSYLTRWIENVPTAMRPLISLMFVNILNRPELLDGLNFTSTSRPFLRHIIEEVIEFLLHSSPMSEKSIIVARWIKAHHKEISTEFLDFSFARFYFSEDLSELLTSPDQITLQIAANWLLHSVPSTEKLRNNLELVIAHLHKDATWSTFVELHITPDSFCELISSVSIQAFFSECIAAAKLTFHWNEGDFLKIIRNDALYATFIQYPNFVRHQLKILVQGMVGLVAGAQEIQRLASLVGEDAILDEMNNQLTYDGISTEHVVELFNYYKQCIEFFLKNRPLRLLRFLEGPYLVVITNKFPKRVSTLIAGLVKSRFPLFVHMASVMNSAAEIISLEPIEIVLDNPEESVLINAVCALEGVNLPISIISREQMQMQSSIVPDDIVS